MKKVWKYLVVVALICYAAVATVWANREAERQHCTGIDIVIEQQPGAQQQFVSLQGVKAELEPFSSTYTKYQLSDIKLDKIERKLQSNNSYEHVECALTPDGRLRIKILPMIPVARVVTSDGSGYYINRDGKRIDARPVFHTDVPVVSGNFNSKFTAADVLPVVNLVRQDPKLTNLVSMIHARDAKNIYLIPRIKGQVICLGDTNNLPDKVENLMLMYEKIIPYKGWETYDTISVKFKGQIVATRRNKTPQHIPENIVEEEDADEDALQTANPEGLPL